MSPTLLILAGLLGGLMLYAGDMCLYGTTKRVAIDFKRPESYIGRLMADRPPWSGALGGALGPIAAFLSLVGAFHIVQFARPGAGGWATALFILFGFGFCLGGAYHFEWHIVSAVVHRGQPPMMTIVIDVLKNKGCSCLAF